jgi:eukaryotic-like serine/threonine-protein kinase
MSDQPTQPLPSAPQTLAGGRYHVHGRLGAGGMGVVVQATDTRLDREVAIKLLADNLAADDTARERFLREARAAAKLSDPHVVQVHDVDEEQGRPYLVMELVEGPSLGDVLATEGPRDPLEVAEVAADALAGIGRAHEKGLLHRDIKPGNLLQAPSGVIKVTDFGVAHAGDAEQLTRTGMVIGTAPYLAPERRTGQPATVRTDLYALGATLYELLSGRHPEGDTPLDALDVEVPASLRHLLDRLLATDPQQRPASAEAALALLAGEVTPPDRLAATRTTAGAGADATTEAIGAAALPSASAEADAGGGPHTAVLAADDEPLATPGGGRSPISWTVVVAVAVGLLLVAMVFQGMRGDGTDPTPTGVERTEDPAETARNLAEWLRERAGE